MFCSNTSPRNINSQVIGKCDWDIKHRIIVRGCLVVVLFDNTLWRNLLIHVMIEILGEVRDKAIRLIQATYLSIYFQVTFSVTNLVTVLIRLFSDMASWWICSVYIGVFLYGIVMDMQRLYRCFLFIWHRDGSAAFISVFSFYMASWWICSVYIGVFFLWQCNIQSRQKLWYWKYLCWFDTQQDNT